MTRTHLRQIAVYCGSNSGNVPLYQEAAQSVGRSCARRGIGIVYGGGSIGLMGAVADAALEEGGSVTGVIPRKLVELEKEHRGLTRLIEVETMHERKKIMMDEADGFVALPGGYGTMEELFEVLAWHQLGYHHKPVGLLNVAGFFTPLLSMLDTMEQGGLLKPQHRALLLVDEDLDTLIVKMESFVPSDMHKWL